MTRRRSQAARSPRRTTVSGLLAGAAALWLALPSAATELREVRVGAHEGFTRIVFELDRSAGYRVEQAGTESRPALRVTLEASSGPLEAGAHGDVRGVKVAPGPKAVATIPLRRSGLRLQEMILANPPRIVLDLKRAEPAPAPKPVAKSSAPAPKPAPAEPKAAPKPEPVAEAPAIAKAPKPAAEKKPAVAPKPAIEPKPAAEPESPIAPEPAAVKPEPKPAPEPEVAPKPEPAPKVAPRREPEPTEMAKTAAGPKPAAAEPDAEEAAGEPSVEIARRLERGTRLAPERESARPARPTQPERTAKAPAPAPEPAAKAPAPAPASEPGLLERLGGDPLMLGAVAGGLVALVGIAITLRRRSRALPGDLDADAIAAELDGDDAEASMPAEGAYAAERESGSGDDEESPFADLFAAASTEVEAPVSEPVSAPGPHDVFATPRLGSSVSEEPAEEPGPPPVAGPEFDVEAPSEPSTVSDSTFDDASQGEAPMNQDMDLPADRSPFDAPPAGPSMGGASPDVAQMLEAFERRIQGLEQKLEEANEAREKLERQVAAQSEELRVQRAAIARTQRALRTMSRGDEDKATEPALREGETQAKTRVNV